MTSLEDLFSCLFKCNAKSIIMMAFFLTIPISNIIPINAIMVRSVRVINNANNAPTPAEGKVDKIVIG